MPPRQGKGHERRRIIPDHIGFHAGRMPPDAAAIRDSKNPTGPTLHFPRPHLAGLITTLKSAAATG